ncbi:MAG TPA: histidine phosphatase family protein [Burkholderiales bacterium]|nr:histidine phosphatase family protein [Burkholderiales bacterium]
MSNSRICMVRHGETAWNAEGRVQGQTDVPLSAVGEAQARAVRAALAGLRFDALYASDLARVRQTAAPSASALGLEPRLDARLRERHYGKFETLTYAEAKARLPQDYARFRDKDPDYDFGSGERLRDFHARAIACVGEIAARHAGGTVLVFTHGGVLEMVYRHAHGLGLASARDFEIPNAALNWIEIGAGGWRVSAWAGVAHLERALDDLPG